MSDQQMNLANLAELYRQQRMMEDPRTRAQMIEMARRNQGPPMYFNNPVRQPIVQGGMAMRSLAGLDPTEQQRLEDAFMQFPARDYGRR